MAYGLDQYWDKKYVVPKKELCHYEKHLPAADKTRLSVNNLASAFVLLLCGYLFSFLVFLAEQLFCHIGGTLSLARSRSTFFVFHRLCSQPNQHSGCRN